MKVELVQSLCPAATGNYDITGTSPSGDMLGAIFVPAQTITNDTNIASMRWGIGATDLASNIGISMGAQDGAAGAGIRSMFSSTNCLFTATGTGGIGSPAASYNSTLAAGVRLTTSAVTVNRLTNVLLISGTDAAMKVGNQQFTGADSSKVITHGLGGTPDLIILLCSIGQSLTDTNGSGFCVGFWDRRTTSQTSISYYATDNANPTVNRSYASSASVGELLNAVGTQAHVTLTSIGSTQFTITQSATAGTNLYGWIALRGSTQMHSKNILTQTPVGTGVASIVSSMTGRPQAYIALSTRMTSANTFVSDDSAGSFGCNISATNDYSTTTKGCNASTFKNNVATSVARTMLSNTQGMLTADNTGAANVQGVVSTWDTAGVSVNYTNAPGGLLEMAILAFGSATPASSSLRIPTRIFRPVNTVYYSR